MQQEASRRLGFSAKKTMMLAQKLYEGMDTGGETHGLITYMRTDGIYTAPEAIEDARKYIQSEYGEKYLLSEDFEGKNNEEIKKTLIEKVASTVAVLLKEENINQLLKRE